MGIPHHFRDVFHRVGRVGAGPEGMRAHVHRIRTGVDGRHTLVQVFGGGKDFYFSAHAGVVIWAFWDRGRKIREN
jgi:hypothetical protein